MFQPLMKRMESKSNSGFQWFEAMEHLMLFVFTELNSGSADMLELVAFLEEKKQLCAQANPSICNLRPRTGGHLLPLMLAD